MAYVHTLGDSTLDNLYWMLQTHPENEAKKKSVEGQLEARGHRVVSHAYDGFTTRSVLESDRIGKVLPSHFRCFDQYMAKKLPKAGFFSKVVQEVVCPLERLKDSICEAPPGQNRYVVISVGGNDFRENLGNPFRFIQDIEAIQNRYLKILSYLKSLSEIKADRHPYSRYSCLAYRDIRPIIVLQYRTDFRNDPYLIYTLLASLGVIAMTFHISSIILLTAPIWASKSAGAGVLATGAIGLMLSNKIVPLSVTINILSGGKISICMFNWLLETFYRPILERAKEEQLPILDLPNTFNPLESLYTSGIEPNERGGRLIAEGIDHIIKNHKYSQLSLFYSKSNKEPEFVERLNNSDWHVR